MSNALLAWILTDGPPPRHYWAGPGMRPLAALTLYRLPLWPDRAAALRAARALHATLHLSLTPSPLRLRL